MVQTIFGSRISGKDSAKVDAAGRFLVACHFKGASRVRRGNPNEAGVLLVQA